MTTIADLLDIATDCQHELLTCDEQTASRKLDGWRAVQDELEAMGAMLLWGSLAGMDPFPDAVCVDERNARVEAVTGQAVECGFAWTLAQVGEMVTDERAAMRADEAQAHDIATAALAGR